MNHLINELLPNDTDSFRLTNSDPITGQAAWYDLQVKITPAAGEEDSWPQFAPLKPLPGFTSAPSKQAYASHPNVNLKRTWSDILGRRST
jgi:hypothetical protein